MLRLAVQMRPYNSEPMLAPVLHAYRSKVLKATGFTPFRLTFGSEMRLPVDLVRSCPSQLEVSERLRQALPMT